MPSSESTSSRPNVAVAAATFNRPDGLRRLLDSIETLAFKAGEPSVQVVIVDNSVDCNARAQVESRAAGYRFPLHYRHQPERGLAQVRNMALDAAIALDAGWMAFIDDDEFADPAWLDQLLALAAETRATAVVGAVHAAFDSPPPRWIEQGGFLSITRFGQGEKLDFGNTSNVAFDLNFAKHHGLRFDFAFALTGGEDTLFFEDLMQKGGTIVFCRTAIVHETIVPHRATLGWLVKRWVRSGNTDGRIVMRQRPGMISRFAEVFGGGLVRLTVGGGLALLTSPSALAGGGHRPAEHLRVASRGLGFMSAAFGSTIEEYRVIKR